MPTLCSDNNAFRINEKSEYSNGMDACILGTGYSTGYRMLVSEYSV